MIAPPLSLANALADRYRIEREIGAGGMATVYLAHDVRHDRQVAIKVLKPDLSAAVDADRFLSEIRTTARLQHPNILPLFDSGMVEGREGRDADEPDPSSSSTSSTLLYYIMPYIQGESLRDRITRETLLPLDDTVHIMREVADALDYAHRAGIVHRDIKPENILLSGGHAIVADFGIARAVGDPVNSRLTQTGHVVGTPAYLSPEQVTGEPVDARSDIYSLGCMLYECLTGALPFSGPGMAMLAQRVVSPPPSVRSRRPDTPPQVDRAVARAMATQSFDRFATCRDLMAALSAPAGPGASADRRGIVVLPFANHSPAADSEFFSDGLTEEIISDLAGIKSLQVISRTSSMQLKGTTKDVRTIGRELGVRYVLEGGVRTAGNSLRINVQLIDAATDSQLWGEKYRGTMDDVFEVQERVAREVVGALGITLSSEEDRRLAHRSIENVRAFELYLQARQEMRRYGAGSIERGEVLLRRAIEIEGATPPLEALRAWFEVTRVRAGFASGTASLETARGVAHELLKSAPDAPYGHALLGLIDYESGDLVSAVRHFLAAIEREPNDADALFYLGISYIGAGQLAKADEAAARLMASDPLSPLAWLLSGIAPWWSNRVKEGLPALIHGLEMDPGNLIAHWSLGYGYALVGDVEGAWKEAELMQRQGPELPYTIQLTALVHAMSGRREEAQALLTPATGLDAHQKFHLAEAWAMAGDTALAFTLLEEAVHGGFYPGEFIAKHCPFLGKLRGTPRFEAIAETALRRTAEFDAAVAAG